MYPVVLIPPRLEQVAKDLPPLALPPAPTQAKLPSPPKSPGTAPRVVEWGAIAPAVGVVGILGLVLSFLSFASSPGVGLFLLLLTAIVVGGTCMGYGNVQRASYRQRLMGTHGYYRPMKRKYRTSSKAIYGICRTMSADVSDWRLKPTPLRMCKPFGLDGLCLSSSRPFHLMVMVVMLRRGIANLNCGTA